MLGKKIRNARKNKSMTLRQLADESGLTSSYISQVEREIVEPSISSLRRIASSLQVSMFYLLDETEKEVSIVRENERNKFIMADSKVQYEIITPAFDDENQKPSMTVAEFMVEPKSWTTEDYFVHSSAEECIIIIEGSLIIDFGEETHVLNKGDSIYIHREKPHKIYNPLDTVSKALACLTIIN